MLNRQRIGCLMGAVFFLALGIFSPWGNGQPKAYKWTDSEGVVHFTDDPNKIPPEYRERIEKEYDFKDSGGESTKPGGMDKEPKENPPTEKPS